MDFRPLWFFYNATKDTHEIICLKDSYKTTWHISNVWLGKKTELNISGENSENTNPSEASKKNKKKKKKPAPATAEEIGKKVDVVEKKEDVKEVLGEIGDNGGENATEVNVIIFFWQVGPT